MWSTATEVLVSSASLLETLSINISKIKVEGQYFKTINCEVGEKKLHQLMLGDVELNEIEK